MSDSYTVIVKAKYGRGLAVKRITPDGYPPGSVLAGQTKIEFIDSFETVGEAQHAYPDAQLSHELLLPYNTFDHLPDEPDF